MKKLIFVRHGKAEDDSAEFSDFERSLTGRGKLISRLMARRLKDKTKTPGIILSSPAFRALETALIFAGEFGVSPEDIIMNSKIYDGISVKNLPAILSETSEDADTISLFGHNPSFSEIADSLCKDGCAELPKSGAVCISFNVKTWAEIAKKTGKAEYFLKPEKLHE